VSNKRNSAFVAEKLVPLPCAQGWVVGMVPSFFSVDKLIRVHICKMIF
jgi:hypothetical protein